MPQITEAGLIAPTTGRRWRARLIEGDVWGSSGYYSREVLERDGATTWPVGTHVFLDHPGAEERFDRPERSVRDLGGRIDSTPVYETDGLYADIEFYAHTAPIVAEMAADVGMSIRASATVEHGEAAGRSGPVITALHEGISVDVVTRAGAGGKLVQLLESARADITEARNIGQWIESRIHRDFTITADDMAGEGRLTREERIGLSGAIGDALAAFVSRLEADQPQLYTRDLWDDPQDTIAAAIEAVPIVPVVPAGQSTTQESKEDTMPQIEESELAQLREASGRATALETQVAEATARAEAAETALAEAARKADATAIISSIAAESQIVFDDLQVAGLLANLPVKEGALDKPAFTTTVQTHAAKIAEAAGAGTIRGFGPSAPTNNEVKESDVSDAIAGAFGHAQTKEV